MNPARGALGSGALESPAPRAAAASASAAAEAEERQAARSYSGRRSRRPRPRRRQTYNAPAGQPRRMMFEVGFRGHENVRSMHRGTIEVTTSPGLTPAGDCIVGVGADCGCAGLPQDLKGALRDGAARVRVTLIAGGLEYCVQGRGHSGLSLSHRGDMVVRRSTFTCPRTLAVGCDGSAATVPRPMVRALQSRLARGTLRIEVRRRW